MPPETRSLYTCKRAMLALNSEHFSLGESLVPTPDGYCHQSVPQKWALGVPYESQTCVGVGVRECARARERVSRAGDRGKC